MFLRILFIASIVMMAHSLECIYGGQGTVNDRTGAINDVQVTCKSETKFCLHLKSDTTVDGEHIKGFARGCDQEMPGSSNHKFCKAEGCTKKKDERGTTEICCCANDYCNDGTCRTSIFALCFTAIFFFSMFL